MSRKLKKNNKNIYNDFNDPLFDEILNIDEVTKELIRERSGSFDLDDTELNETSATTSNEASAKAPNELAIKSFLNINHECDINSQIDFPNYFAGSKQLYACIFCNEKLSSDRKHAHLDHHLRLFLKMLTRLCNRYGDEQYLKEFLDQYEKCYFAYNSAEEKKRSYSSNPSTPNKSMKLDLPGYTTPKSSVQHSLSSSFQESKEDEQELQKVLSIERYPIQFKINFYLWKKQFRLMCATDQNNIVEESLFYWLAKGLKDESITANSVKDKLLASKNLFEDKAEPDSLLEHEQYFEIFRCFYKKGITLYHWNNNVLSVLREEERKDIQLVMYHNEKSGKPIFLLLESTID